MTEIYKKPKFRSAYDKPVRVAIDCQDPSLTQQSDKDKADIKKIIAKYDKTGLILHVNKMEARFEDVSEVKDLKVTSDIIRNAESDFNMLPSDVRKEFDNDMYKFYEALESGDQRLVDFGLVESSGGVGVSPTEETGTVSVAVETPVSTPAEQDSTQ